MARPCEVWALWDVGDLVSVHATTAADATYAEQMHLLAPSGWNSDEQTLIEQAIEVLPMRLDLAHGDAPCV